MNELTVFNKDVIPVYTNDKGQKIVLGRELHEELKVETKYLDWFLRMPYMRQNGLFTSVKPANAVFIQLAARR